MADNLIQMLEGLGGLGGLQVIEGGRCTSCGPQSKKVYGGLRGLGDILQIGSSGSEVTYLQDRLTTLGFATSPVSGARSDGKFGTNTQQAVMAFQKKMGLKVDGIAGPATIDAIECELCKKGASNPQFCKAGCLPSASGTVLIKNITTNPAAPQALVNQHLKASADSIVKQLTEQLVSQGVPAAQAAVQALQQAQQFLDQKAAESAAARGTQVPNLTVSAPMSIGAKVAIGIATAGAVVVLVMMFKKRGNRTLTTLTPAAVAGLFGLPKRKTRRSKKKKKKGN